MASFRSENLGKYSDTSEFLLEPEKGIAYAKATNDFTKEHLDGSFMPPVYGVVPVWQQVFDTLNTIVPAEHFFSVVHGEQEMIWHRPLKSGLTLRSRARAESISVKDSGTTLVIKAESADANTDELVLEQYFTMFFRGVNGGDFEGNFVGNKRISPLDVNDYKTTVANKNDSEVCRNSTKTKMDEDQTYRYSKASGDMMPIHIDDEFAKSVGLGGIIIHGLCTMANARAVIINGHCKGDLKRLSAMSLRFANPLRPGDEIETSVFHPGEKGQLEKVAGGDSHYFDTVRTSDDLAILTNGLVYIR